MTTNKTYVWDIFVRLFHWSLVALILFNFGVGPEHGWGEVHEMVGYIAVGLILARIVWGFIGTKYARWTDFFPTPSRIVGYLRGTYKPVGHNPIGSLMIIALLVLTLGVGYTGWAVEHSNANPLAAITQTVDTQQPIETAAVTSEPEESEEGEGAAGKGEENEAMEDLHKTLVNTLMGFALIHILAALLHDAFKRTGLIRSMITGYKKK